MGDQAYAARRTGPPIGRLPRPGLSNASEAISPRCRARAQFAGPHARVAYRVDREQPLLVLVLAVMRVASGGNRGWTGYEAGALAAPLGSAERALASARFRGTPERGPTGSRISADAGTREAPGAPSAQSLHNWLGLLEGPRGSGSEPTQEPATLTIGAAPFRAFPRPLPRPLIWLNQAICSFSRAEWSLL